MIKVIDSIYKFDKFENVGMIYTKRRGVINCLILFKLTVCKESNFI